MPINVGKRAASPGVPLLIRSRPRFGAKGPSRQVFGLPRHHRIDPEQGRGRASSSILLLQTLAEFSNVAWRKARIHINEIRRTIDAGVPCCRYKAPKQKIY